MTWPIVTLVLGLLGAGLTFYWLRMSAHRVVSLLELEHRIRLLEAKLPDQGVPAAVPRGLPQPRAFGGRF